MKQIQPEPSDLERFKALYDSVGIEYKITEGFLLELSITGGKINRYAAVDIVHWFDIDGKLTSIDVDHA